MSIQLRKAATWLIALTGLSYFLAYLRDAGVAALYGASPTTDAFFVGTFLPMMVYTVVITGSFVPALLPVLASIEVQSLGPEAQSHLRQDSAQWAGLVTTASRWLLLAMLVVVAVGELNASLLVGLLAPGFDAHTADMAALFLRAGLPMLVFLGPAALAGALLNFRHNFMVPASGTLVFSGTVFASVAVSGGGRLWVVALAMVVGAALQFALNIRALDPASRSALLKVWTPGDSQAAGKVARLAMPMLLYMALTQALPLIERLLASSLPGGVLSHMAYAAKLNNLPVMVVATSLATALFPGMAQQAQDPNHSSLAATIRNGLSYAALLIAPISAWLITCSALVVPIVFGRGSFTSADSAATAQLLGIYATGLLPLALSVLLARAFYSKHEPWPPVLAGVVCMAAYVVLGTRLTAWGAPGLALAMVIANWIGVFLLLALLAKSLAALRPGRLLADNVPVVAAAVAGGLACWSFQLAWSGIGQLQGWWAQSGVLLALTLAGGATYFAVYRLLRTRAITHYALGIRHYAKYPGAR